MFTTVAPPRTRRTALLLAILLALSTAGLVGLAKPAAAAPSSVQMPFPCGETWHASTYSGHQPSEYSVDWNLMGTDDGGKPVLAGANGTATVYFGSEYGNYVDVNIDGGWVLRYAHLATVSVSNNQVINPQTQLGTVGSTGSSTGNHLHYEQRLNGSVKPATFNGSAITYVYSYNTPNPYTSANCVSYESLAADFNADGLADLALREAGSGAIYIRFNNGTGSFGNQIVYDWAPGMYFQFLAADFDGNGGADLVLRNTGSGTFYIRYSSSSGFGNQTTYTWAPGTYFQSLAADFNADGYADLALRDTGSGTVYIRYGNGSGSFANQTTYTWAPGTYFQSLAEDFNGNGGADLVLRDTGSGTFYIRYGNGAGSFGNQTTYTWAPGTYFQSLAADFNADGYADLALRDKGTGWFYTRYGQLFSSQTTYNWPATG